MYGCVRLLMCDRSMCVSVCGVCFCVIGVHCTAKPRVAACVTTTLDFFARVHTCMRMRRSMSEGFGLHGAVAGSRVQKKAQTPTPRHAHTHACVHTRTHVHTQIHTRTRTRTHAHEYTHMHMHARGNVVHSASTIPSHTKTFKTLKTKTPHQTCGHG